MYLMKILCVACAILMITGSVAFAAEPVVISVGEAQAEQGGRVTIPITLESNPGLVGIHLSVEYDAARLTIENANAVSTGTAPASLSFAGVTNESAAINPLELVWFGLTPCSAVGLMANIEFSILPGAPAGHTPVNVTAGRGGVYTNDNIHAEMSITNGGVTVGNMPPTTAPGQSPAPVTTPSPAPGQSPAPVTTPSPAPGQSPAPVATPSPAPGESPAPVATPSPAPGESPAPVATPSPAPGQSPAPVATPAPGQSPAPEAIRTAPASNLPGVPEIDAADAENEPVAFADVAPDAWYYSAITFAAARGLFAGVGDSLFAPQLTMNRAMFITVLARLDGFDPSRFAASPFGDTAIASWYGPAVAWASHEGILCDGIIRDPGQFAPYASITREEMAVIFANYLSRRDFTPIASDVPQFYDLQEAAPHAQGAIQTMRRYGIISGIGGNRYNPQANATRAEVAQIFMNLVRGIEV